MPSRPAGLEARGSAFVMSSTLAKTATCAVPPEPHTRTTSKYALYDASPSLRSGDSRWYSMPQKFCRGKLASNTISLADKAKPDAAKLIVDRVLELARRT